MFVQTYAMSSGIESACAPPLRSSSDAPREPWLGALSLANLAIAAYLVVTAPGDALAALSPGCMTCSGSGRISLTERDPWFVLAAVVVWLAAVRLGPSEARVARGAMLVSAAAWVVSLGTARGWWLS